MTERFFESTGATEVEQAQAGEFGSRTNAKSWTALRDYPGQVVSLTLSRFSARDVPWAISQMQWSKRPLRAIPEIGFLKLMGTGGGAGFSTRPNLNVWTILSTWPSGAAADRAQLTAVFAGRRKRAAESATFHLAPVSVRGRWAGQAPFKTDGPARSDGPVVALTRATVRKRMLARFWRRVPSISHTIEGEGSVRFMIGMGEVPYLHQVTFSIWDDADAMARFSRESATHGDAVRMVAKEGWFSEQLFARFRPIAGEGTWNGRSADDLLGLE